MSVNVDYENFKAAKEHLINKGFEPIGAITLNVVPIVVKKHDFPTYFMKKRQLLVYKDKNNLYTGIVVERMNNDILSFKEASPEELTKVSPLI